jgi:hypothetical protein
LFQLHFSCCTAVQKWYIFKRLHVVKKLM